MLESTVKQIKKHVKGAARTRVLGWALSQIPSNMTGTDVNCFASVVENLAVARELLRAERWDLISNGYDVAEEIENLRSRADALDAAIGDLYRWMKQR